MSRRSPEQVHEEDGHSTAVASCSLCPADPEPAGETVVDGEPGPELAVKALSARRPRPGDCGTDGCTGKGTHGGRCHDCHNRPG